MEWQDVLFELVEAVKSSSELVWFAARRQAMMEGVQYLIGALGTVIVLGVLLFLLKVTWRNMQKEIATNSWTDSWDDTNGVFAFVLLILFSLAAFVIALCFLGSSVSRFINPDFYAIKMLIELIRGGG